MAAGGRGLSMRWRVAIIYLGVAMLGCLYWGGEGGTGGRLVQVRVASGGGKGELDLRGLEVERI